MCGGRGAIGTPSRRSVGAGEAGRWGEWGVLGRERGLGSQGLSVWGEARGGALEALGRAGTPVTTGWVAPGKSVPSQGFGDHLRGALQLPNPELQQDRGALSRQMPAVCRALLPGREGGGDTSAICQPHAGHMGSTSAVCSEAGAAGEVGVALCAGHCAEQSPMPALAAPPGRSRSRAVRLLPGHGGRAAGQDAGYGRRTALDWWPQAHWTSTLSGTLRHPVGKLARTQPKAVDNLGSALGEHWEGLGSGEAHWAGATVLLWEAQGLLIPKDGEQTLGAWLCACHVLSPGPLIPWTQQGRQPSPHWAEREAELRARRGGRGGPGPTRG